MRREKEKRIISNVVEEKYKYGFVTEIEQDTLPPGLNEDVIRIISKKKNEPDWLLQWRLKAFKIWMTMDTPKWAHLNYPKIDSPLT